MNTEYDPALDKVKAAALTGATNEAKNNLARSVKDENWSDANCKRGYMMGLIERGRLAQKQSDSETVARVRDEIETKKRMSLRIQSYGNAAFWQAYLQGWDVAHVICEGL